MNLPACVRASLFTLKSTGTPLKCCVAFQLWLAVTHNAVPVVSILAIHVKIICQNLILKHYECHPVFLLLIEL